MGKAEVLWSHRDREKGVTYRVIAHDTWSATLQRSKNGDDWVCPRSKGVAIRLLVDDFKRYRRRAGEAELSEECIGECRSMLSKIGIEPTFFDDGVALLIAEREQLAASLRRTLVAIEEREDAAKSGAQASFVARLDSKLRKAAQDGWGVLNAIAKPPAGVEREEEG